MRRRVLHLLLVSTIPVIGMMGTARASSGAGAGREARVDYVATNEGVVALSRFATMSESSCPSSGSTLLPPLPAVGGACYEVDPGESEVRVRVVDASGLPVGGVLYFERSRWSQWGERYIDQSRLAFCGRVVVAIPEGAVRLGIEVGGDNDLWRSQQGTGDPDRLRPCGPEGGVPTAGTVVAFFTAS